MTLIERTVRERIVVVGVVFSWSSLAQVEEDLDELELLVATAGADVVARVIQRRAEPDPATLLGKGKAAELHEVALAHDADTVVFDAELTPAQQRNLEHILGRTAIDRTAVILDIFAQNASSQEGKVQVELALLRYRLPRLRGRGHALSQQAGGIGTRGPGETKLEMDRRRLLTRMSRLEAELRDVAASRAYPGPRTASLASAARLARRVHQCRQVDFAQPADQCGCPGRRQPFLDTRCPHETPRVARGRDGSALGHCRVRSQASASARRSLQADPRDRARRRPAHARGRRLIGRSREADRSGALGARGDRRRPRPGAARGEQDGPVTAMPPVSLGITRDRSQCRRQRAWASTSCSRRWATG